MRRKDESKKSVILDFIDEYYNEYNEIPAVRTIAEGTGIALATTKIWDVSAHVSKLLTYVANKNKITMEIKSGTDDEEMRLAAEMLGLPSDHFATEEKKFVTGINCTPENANEVMLALLEGVDSSDIQVPFQAILHRLFLQPFESRYSSIIALTITMRPQTENL